MVGSVNDSIMDMNGYGDMIDDGSMVGGDDGSMVGDDDSIMDMNG